MPGHIHALLLSEYLDGELAGRKRAGVERHLAECGFCRTRFEELRSAVQLVALHGRQPCPLDPHETAWHAITNAARYRGGVTIRGWRRPIWRLGMIGVLATSLVLGLALGMQRAQAPQAGVKLVHRDIPDVRTLHDAYRSQQALGGPDGIILTAW